MNSEEFVQLALVTESKPEKLNFSLGGLLLLLSVGAQVGDIIDVSKKTMFYGKPLDKDALRSKVESLQAELTLLHSRIDRLATPEDTETPFHQPNLRIAHGAIGMFTESGELLEAVVKQIIGGKIDLVNVAEETGDSDWYKAIIHDETGVSELTTRTAVIDKLKARYGDKFSAAAALNRNLDAERTTLETSLTGAAATQAAVEEARTITEPRFDTPEKVLEVLDGAAK